MDLQTWLKQTGTSQAAFAEQMTAIGRRVTQGAISQWLKKGRIPAERVPQIVEATNGELTYADLRPDLYGRRPLKNTNNHSTPVPQL